MPVTQAAPAEAKRGSLTGAALSDEVFDSSPTLLRTSRGGRAVTGLQQYFTPPEAADLVAAVNGRTASTLDLTAGNGALLAGVDPDLRFGIEIDRDQIEAHSYEAIHGDVQHAVPLLRLLGTRFPRVACNPPFGLDWSLNGHTENSTVATWRMALSLLARDGLGAFIAGRDRFERDILGRPDAGGIYAHVECEDGLFEGVSLPCTIAFFVHPERPVSPRDGGPLRLSAPRSELTSLADRIIEERRQVGVYIAHPFRCADRDSLVQRFKTVRAELHRRRTEASAKRQKFDLALHGGRISSRPSAFARLALGQRKLIRNVECLHNQPTTYFALNLREWRQLRALAEEEVMTVDPLLIEAVDDATSEAERAICPLYEVRPQQRLAFLDDLDSILCTHSDPERGLEAGERYPLVTSSDIKVTQAERPHTKRNGDVEIRKCEHEAKVLRVEIDGQVFNEAAADVEYLLAHFELPDPGDLATRFPAEVERARSAVLALIALWHSS
jgi:hypothetical protein